MASAALLVAEIVRANLPAGRLDDWPWKVQLLGIPTSAALLVASLAFLTFRDQYARSTAPLLRYVSQWVASSEEVTASADRYRQVVVRNAGLGTAVIVEVTWTVAVGSDAPVHVASMEALRARLAAAGLTDGVDYVIGNYSPGAALGPGEEQPYFECTDVGLARFQVFDALFEFGSLIGDRYERPVSLLPRAGASPAVSSAG